jgi:RNA polymerase sigma factor (sigma-70 family)
LCSDELFNRYPTKLLAPFLISQSKHHSLAITNVIKNSAAAVPDRTHRFGQEELFYSLYEFALRICCRYTSYKSNPEKTVYEGFIKLFKSVGKKNIGSGSLFFIRNRLKDILIDACIEKARLEVGTEQRIPEKDISIPEASRERKLKRLSPEEMMNALRRLPFPGRIVFNLSVMDGFHFQEISSKLQISITEVEANLNIAREKLRAEL